MSKVTVDAGACKFKAVIHAHKTGQWTMTVRVSSGCEMLTRMNPELAEINWQRGVFGKIQNSAIYAVSSQHIRHTACPVPAAILKAMEVEAELALPVDVSMRIEEGPHE